MAQSSDPWSFGSIQRPLVLAESYQVGELRLPAARAIRVIALKLPEACIQRADLLPIPQVIFPL